jgi:FAD/FMN-containing dehydrogenase
MTTSPTRAATLESLLDPSRTSTDPNTLSTYAIHNRIPQAVVKPATPEEAAQVVRYATTEKLSVIPTGARTKLEIGATPTRYDIALDMTSFQEIAHYDPADLTISVGAGMPLAALNAKLLEHNQFLPLLVPYYSQATIGGAIASGLDSPLRQHYGTARDFLLGAEFIDGTGAQVKSGGRVVKNVTGYDLHKLLIGSLGNLAVITRLNFRTFPSPANSRGFVASFPTHQAALALRKKIAASPLAPLTLDILNPQSAKLFATRTPTSPEPQIFSPVTAVAPVAAAGLKPGEQSQEAQSPTLPLPGPWFHPNAWQVCAAFAGPQEVLDRNTRDLTRLAQETQATSVNFLDDSTRPSIWGRLREALPLFRESTPPATIFRLSILPGHHPATITLLEAVAQAANLPLALIARASGPIYAALLPESSDPAVLNNLTHFAHEIFALSRSRAGDATLLFAPHALRSTIPPQPTSSLSSTIKAAFDPQNTFAPTASNDHARA